MEYDPGTASAYGAELHKDDSISAMYIVETDSKYECKRAFTAQAVFPSWQVCLELPAQNTFGTSANLLK
jgi:hypothetical protein